MAKLLRASATVGGGASQVELDLKAPIASPTFTGTVAGVSATHVGLGNVDNVADASQASVGTIASGTWEGTTVAVAQGGTGVTSKTGTGNVVLSSSPTLVTPALGTPASGVMTNVTGTASGLTAGTVTTNANLTGDVTSSGNATVIASDVIVNADVKSDAAIAMSKTALVGGTGLTLSTNTLNVDAAQTQITSVGTITTGTWEGTTVAVNQGGTGAATHTANNVMIGAGTSALTSIAPGADGQVLTSTGSVWQSEAAAGITEADQWRVTTGFNIGIGEALVDDNWARNNTLFDKIGTGMSQSSGVFTFPSTGIWWVMISGFAYDENDAARVKLTIKATKTAESHVEIAMGVGSLVTVGSVGWGYASCNAFLDVTTAGGTSECSFYAESPQTIFAQCSPTTQRFGVTFIRLGDT